jgi:5-methylcytosine-specific restriction endonuclease McrA
MNRDAWWSRKRRSSTSWIRKSTRYAIYHRDGFDCVWCRSIFPISFAGEDLTLDHIVPRCHGGTNKPDNLVTSCRSCNSSRGSEVVTGHVLRRALMQAAKPLNQEIGRVLSAMFSPMQPSKRLKRFGTASSRPIHPWKKDSNDEQR